MAFYSLVMYAGDGSNKNFPFHFFYLDKAHVKAKVGNTPTTAFTWLTNNTIQFNTAPAAGTVIEIYRETPLNYPPVDFTDGSILLEQDLDLLTTFNLYVDQEIKDKATLALSIGQEALDKATLAISMGSGGASNSQGSGTTAADAAAAEAARAAAEKAAREAEAARDAALKAGGGAGSGSGSNGSNGGDGGDGNFSSLKVKGKPNAYVDVQASNDMNAKAECGVRYFPYSGTPKYQSIYTPSDGLFRYKAADAKAEWRWGINGSDGAMSFKRVTGVSSLENDHYMLSLGLPPLATPDGLGRPVGGALRLYGTSQSMRYPKIELFNDGQLNGFVIASDYELNLCGVSKVTLMGQNQETFFTAWRDRAVLIYGGDRNNDMQWQGDGNIVVYRNKNAVWNINNQITSDVRLKTDIKPLEGSSLEKVKQLNAKTYLWKDDLMGKGDKREIGLIAQEVAKVVPEVVSKMSSSADTLGVAYTQLVPLLVEAVKELSAKVESLEAQLLSKE